MKKTTNRKSLQQWIRHFNIYILSGVLIALLFYLSTNLYTMHKYTNAFYQLQNISGFYEYIDHANEDFKEYLNTDDASSYKTYQKNIREAKSCLTQLSQMKLHGSWRITLLKSMLTSYIDQVEVTKLAFESNVNTQVAYTNLLDTYELTKETSDVYYEILTTNMELQNQRFTSMKRLILCSSILFAILLFIWIRHFTKKTTKFITDPLSAILMNIEIIKKGRYDLTKISNTNQEMYELCEAMEEMASAIQRDVRTTKEKALLEKRLLEKENENLKKDELLAQSEVKMLQNQINPHFLFNTLNMTYRFALSEKAYKCSEMIERISTLLRYGLDKQNKMSDLDGEIAAAKNYIAIQEKRLGDRIQFTMFTDDHLPNIIMPGMIVQPLIENSLKHGLKNCVEHGEINISFQYSHPYLSIQVSDNGEGMDSELCEQMVLANFKQETGDHLGLYNVVKRLQMCYQEHVDIMVQSEKECGFLFQIRIEVTTNE